MSLIPNQTNVNVEEYFFELQNQAIDGTIFYPADGTSSNGMPGFVTGIATHRINTFNTALIPDGQVMITLNVLGFYTFSPGASPTGFIQFGVGVFPVGSDNMIRAVSANLTRMDTTNTIGTSFNMSLTGVFDKTEGQLGLFAVNSSGENVIGGSYNVIGLTYLGLPSGVNKVPDNTLIFM